MYDIELKNINVYYKDVCALKNINLKIKKNDFIGILGPNGGGKTTLLKVILGLIDTYEGEVIVGEGVSVGYVPQFTAFNKSFPINVRDVIASLDAEAKGEIYNLLKEINELWQ